MPECEIGPEELISVADVDPLVYYEPFVLLMLPPGLGVVPCGTSALQLVFNFDVLIEQGLCA